MLPIPRYALEATPLIQKHFPRRLVRPRQQAADHHRVRPGADRLHDVSARPHPAIRDRRHAALPARRRRLQHRRELRHPHPGHHPRCADATRPDADFHSIRPRRDQRHRPLRRGNVPRHHLHGVGHLLDPSPPSPSQPAECPCAVSTTSTSVSASISNAGADACPSSPTPIAAATRSRPNSSLLASGCACAFSISLTVIRPDRSGYASSTTSSFSNRCLCSSRFGPQSGRHAVGAPSSSPSRVISSYTLTPGSVANRTSRLVRIPTNRPLSRAPPPARR